MAAKKGRIMSEADQIALHSAQRGTFAVINMLLKYGISERYFYSKVITSVVPDINAIGKSFLIWREKTSPILEPLKWEDYLAQSKIKDVVQEITPLVEEEAEGLKKEADVEL